MMAVVELDEQEWQQVMNLIADAPWKVANPLLMKLGEQLQRQQTNIKQQTNNAKVAAAQEEVASSRAN
jgi:hypothetical protein